MSANAGEALIEHHTEVEAVLSAHGERLGAHRDGYRNHVYRVLNVVHRLAPEVPVDFYAVVLAFHDLAIWTHGTFDYLAPSAMLLETHLRQSQRAEWIPSAVAALEWHHKLTPYRGAHADVVEPLRRADLADVSFGLVREGLPRPFLRALRRRFPSAGFHRLLVLLGLRQLVRTPWRPLPMLRR